MFILNFSLLICIVNTMLIHSFLTRKKSTIYCVVALIINTISVFAVELLITTYIHNLLIAKYANYASGFLYIVYILLIFQESVPKKLFTMFSIWIFSIAIFFISATLANSLSDLFNIEIYTLIYILRVILQIIFIFVAYLWLSKPYKKILGLVPNKTIIFMSLYPIAAFFLLVKKQPVSIDSFTSSSFFDILSILILIILGYLTVFIGISAASELELQRYMANYDNVTGIFNRANMMNQLTKTIEISKRSKLKFALLIYDLDDFKKINDEYGHLVGDKALRHLSQAIQQVARSSDILGRYGGDEFVIIQPFIQDERDVEALVYRIFDVLKAPVRIDDNEIQISISIGVSLFPDYSSDLEILISQADRAMYEAKKRDGCSYSLFK